MNEIQDAVYIKGDCVQTQSIAQDVTIHVRNLSDLNSIGCQSTISCIRYFLSTPGGKLSKGPGGPGVIVPLCISE